MPGNIPDSYASPGLRIGLLLEDHPTARVDYTIEMGSDLGIPPEQGGDEQFVVASIVFGTDRHPAVGWKALSSRPTKKDGSVQSFDHPSDQYNLNCTKALGRALKRAGYPDDIDDLRALVRWRRENAQLQALLAGQATVQLQEAKPEDALALAAKSDPENDGTANDDVIDMNEGEDGVYGARGDLSPPGDEQIAELRRTINALGKQSSMLTAWARNRGYRVTRPSTVAECRDLIEEGKRMIAASEPQDGIEGPDAPSHPSEDRQGAPAGESEQGHEVAELVAGLNEEERKGFDAYCASLSLDPESDWTAAAPEVLSEILAWMAVG